MTRQILRVSMNDEEIAVFKFFKQRLSITEDSAAFKQAIELGHYFLDNMQRAVPHEIFLQYLARLKYEKKLYEQTFESWKKEQSALKGLKL